MQPRAESADGQGEPAYGVDCHGALVLLLALRLRLPHTAGSVAAKRCLTGSTCRTQKLATCH